MEPSRDRQPEWEAGTDLEVTVSSCLKNMLYMCYAQSYRQGRVQDPQGLWQTRQRDFWRSCTEVTQGLLLAHILH